MSVNSLARLLLFHGLDFLVDGLDFLVDGLFCSTLASLADLAGRSLSWAAVNIS
jgi:hypothetical protein